MTDATTSSPTASTAKADTKADTKAKSKADTKANTKAKSEADTKAKSEADTKAKSEADTAPEPDTRTPAEIEADLSKTRDRMASTIDELQARVAPSAIAARGRAKIKGLVVDEYGGIRVERVAVAGAVVVALFVVPALFRRARR